MKLTTQTIASYRPPEGKDHIVFDEELSGFGLRYRNGRRTWVFQYAFGGGAARVNARMTLGDYPALPATKARETAQDLYAKVRLGQHPAAEKKQTARSIVIHSGVSFPAILNLSETKSGPAPIS